MRKPKEISFCVKALSAVLAGIMAVPSSILAQSAARLNIRQVGETVLRLELQGGPTNAMFQVQVSTNLGGWETRAATRTHPGSITPLADIQPTNSAQFFRLQPLPPGLV